MNRHNGTVGYRGYSDSGLSNTQRNALSQINAGWIFTNTEKGFYTLTTFKSLADKGLIDLEVNNKTWTARKVGA
jgi:hypothetical protein